MDFNEIGKKLTSRVRRFSQDTVSEVQKMNEIRQVKSRISEQRKTIEDLYAQMGKKLYEIYKEIPMEGFETQFSQIAECELLIDQANEELEQIRSAGKKPTCPNCGKEVSEEAAFCPNCGTKLPEPAVPEEADDLDWDEETEEETDAAQEPEEGTFVSSEPEEKTLVQEAIEKAYDASENAEEAVEAAEDAAKDVAEAVQDVAEEAVEAAEDAAKDVAEAVQDAAEEAVEAAEDAVKEAAETVQETTEA